MTSNYPDEINKALANQKVEALFEMIERQTPITFIRSKDQYWGSSTRHGTTEIEFASTKAPVEALAHELLHAELKLGGYQQLTAMVALAPSERKNLYLNVLSMLDNELQHHRMFKRFSDLGLSGKRFYCDSDKNTYTTVRNTLQGMSASDHAADFLLQFVSIIAPGGAGDERQRQPLKNFLKTRCSPNTWEILMEVEGIFAAWRNSSSMNASESVADIFRQLIGDDRLWFGPPGCQDLALGHFVGPQFTVDDAYAYGRE